MKSEAIDQLSAALAKARPRFTPMVRNQTADVRGKNKKTGEYYNYSYKYIDLPAILDAVYPALSGVGISIVQCPQLEPEFSLNTMLVHESGQFLQSSMPLPRNVPPQELGSYITYYRRYALAAMLGIAAEDDDDGAAAQAGHTSQQQRSIEVIPGEALEVLPVEDAAPPPEATQQARFEMAVNELFNRGATAISVIGGYSDPFAEMGTRMDHTLRAHDASSVADLTVRAVQLKFYRDLADTVNGLEAKAEEVAEAGV